MIRRYDPKAAGYAFHLRSSAFALRAMADKSSYTADKSGPNPPCDLWAATSLTQADRTFPIRVPTHNSEAPRVHNLAEQPRGQNDGCL